jgi:hypothetical protein
MSCSLKLTCLLAALWMPVALAQTATTQANIVHQSSTSAAPVAFVYVSSGPYEGTDQVYAFAAATNGRLTPVPGSPFHDNVTNMAVNGKYLFGANKKGVYIAQFLIEPNGALHWIQSINPDRYDVPGCSGLVGQLFLDHTGSTLYDQLFDFLNCGSDVGQSFEIERPSGGLKFLGGDDQLGLFSTEPSFIGNNVYAYGAECDFFDHGVVPLIYGFHRQSNGMLTVMHNFSATTPAVKAGDDLFCPSRAAADRTNHVAISLQALTQFDDSPDGAPQLATYIADSSGNLSTTSTYQNMPTTAVGTVLDMRMSPTGKLLAVGGVAGLQVFHFNGSAPITHDTGLLVKDLITQMFWDNAGHLYAIGSSKLYVFTATSAGFSQAPGSPYTISNPVNIIVQPKTPQPAIQ